MRVGVPVVDMATGLNACIGILMALHERNRVGQGPVRRRDAVRQRHRAAPSACAELLHGRAPKPKLVGNSHGNLAPYSNFPTKGRNIVVGAGNDGQFRKLTQMLGKPELADDPRFKTNKDRVANRPALEAELRALTKDRDGESFANELMQNGVPSGAVMESARRHGAPHTRHRGMVWEKDGYRNVGNPVKLSRTPASPRSKPQIRRRHQGGAGRAWLLGRRDRQAGGLRHGADRDQEIGEHQMFQPDLLKASASGRYRRRHGTRPVDGARYLELRRRIFWACCADWPACARASPDCRRSCNHPSPTPCRDAWCAGDTTSGASITAPEGTPICISSLAKLSPSRSLVRARNSASSAGWRRDPCWS